MLGSYAIWSEGWNCTSTSGRGRDASQRTYMKRLKTQKTKTPWEPMPLSFSLWFSTFGLVFPSACTPETNLDKPYQSCRPFSHWCIGLKYRTRKEHSHVPKNRPFHFLGLFLSMLPLQPGPLNNQCVGKTSRVDVWYIEEWNTNGRVKGWSTKTNSYSVKCDSGL